MRGDALDRERPRPAPRGPAGRRTAAPSRRCRRRRGSARPRAAAAPRPRRPGPPPRGRTTARWPPRSTVAVVDRAPPSPPGRPGSRRRPATTTRLDAEVVRGLVEGRVARRRAAPSAAASTSGRASRAVCTASSTDSVPPEVTVPTRRLGRVEQVGRRSRPGRSPSRSRLGERGRVQPVGAGVRRDRLAADPVDLGEPGVVDVGQGAAAVDRQVAACSCRGAGRARRSWASGSSGGRPSASTSSASRE